MKDCKYCNKNIVRNKKYSNAQWLKVKFCSSDCFGKDRKSTGWTQSLEARIKLSESHKGTKKPWSGKYKRTIEHKRKIGESVRKRFISNPGIRLKISLANRGRKKSIQERKAISERQKGSKNRWWKGGLTPINKVIRRSPEMKAWRDHVFKRDNWTCQHCKIRGGKLHPHHIKPFSLFPDLRFNIDNGITLCEPCHFKTDTYGAKILKYKKDEKDTN